jgi:DNA-binding transcriptional regulator GbsR (MarR family)
MGEDEPELHAAIEQCAAVLAGAGFPRMPARVLLHLLAAENGGLTAAELGTRLGVSAAAVSGAVRYLELVNVVHRVARGGTRRLRWEVLDDSWYTSLAGQGAIYVRTAEAAERIARAMADTGSPPARRMTDMAAFFRFLDRRIPALLEEWRTGAAQERHPV